MEVTTVPRAEGWRGRGRPRREIPPQVAELARQTYKTGNIGQAVIADGEEDQARELASLLTAYAEYQGRRMRIQYDGNVMRWEMVDKRKRVAK